MPPTPHPSGNDRYTHCPKCGAALGLEVRGERERLVCPACRFVFFQNPNVGVAAIVVEDGAVLLTRRGGSFRPGLWDLPGGFCDPDETPEDCAVRELAEETGCAIHVDRFLGHLIDTYGADGDFTLNAVFVAHITAGEPVPADDVAELRWFALDDLPGRELLAFRSTSEALGLLGT